MAVLAASPSYGSGVLEADRESAIGLLRISDDSEKLGLGVKRQLEDLNTVADELNLNLYAIYEDNDQSGWQIGAMDRPGFVGMVEELRSGQHRYALVYAIDRFGRRADELITDLLNMAWKLKVILIVATPEGFQRIDPSIGRDRITFRQEAVNAEAYSEKIAALQQRKQRQLAKEGKPNGMPTFGIDIRFDPETGQKERVENQQEADLIRSAITQLLEEEATLTTILRQWRKAGAKTRRAGEIRWIRQADGTKRRTVASGEWTKESLRRLLMNPALAGIRIAHDYETDPDTRRRLPTGSFRENPEGTWPAIIDLRTHKQIVRLLGSRNLANAKADVKTAIPGTLVRCGICGEPMSRFHRNRKEISYSCRPGKYTHSCGKVSIHADLFEEVIGAYIVQRIKEAREHGLGGGDPAASRERELANQLSDLEEELGALEIRYVTKKTQKKPYERAKQELTRQQREALRELSGLQRNDQRRAAIARLEALDEQSWEKLPVLEKRRYAELLIREVRVMPDKVRGPFRKGKELERIQQRLFDVEGRSTVQWW